VGKKQRLRKEKIEQAKTEQKKTLEKIYHEKNPWVAFWRRADFWIYLVCVAAIVAWPFTPMGQAQIPTVNEAVLHTSMGDITIEFYSKDAPNTVANFQKLANSGFYKNMIWHRVIKGFVIQTGDPAGDGTGGPGYKFNDEINSRPFTVGAVGMANAGPNTNGSQFFIVNGPTAESSLDGKYTNFAQVVSGADVVQKISNTQIDSNDKPINNVYLESVEIK
jgi:cyclophilin family peptidyl-prolyl cis-trans isomerase